MKEDLVRRLFGAFDAMVRTREGVEHWHARKLQEALGYAQWLNFAEAIERARTICKNSGRKPQDHSADISTMVELGSGAKRELELRRIRNRVEESEPRIADSSTAWANRCLHPKRQWAGVSGRMLPRCLSGVRSA